MNKSIPDSRYLMAAILGGLALWQLSRRDGGEPKQQTAALGKLHTEGVVLRNAGVRLKSRNDVPAWYTQYCTWKDRVMAVLMPMSPAKAQRIMTLNRLPSKGVYRFWGAKSRAHRTHLRTLERRLEVLQEIIGEYGNGS